MNTTGTSQISVIDPIRPAFDRVNLLLFKPFDLRKWFVIGFCAWLAYLGQGGFRIRLPFGYKHPAPDAAQQMERAKDFVLEYLPWFILGGIVLLAVIVTVAVVIMWLRSRGQFMFLHCVAENKAQVKAPWAKFRRRANSLFLFQLVLALITCAVTAIFALIAFLIGFVFKAAGGFDIASIVAFVIGIAVFLVVLTVILIVKKFTTDFVVPIMYLEAEGCVTGWRRFIALLAANKGNFTLYILFQVVISLCIVFVVLAAVCVTCCIIGCLLAIPYIGAVAMLPILVFMRSYSLYYFRQFGPQYDVFQQADPLLSEA